MAPEDCRIFSPKSAPRPIRGWLAHVARDAARISSPIILKPRSIQGVRAARIFRLRTRRCGFARSRPGADQTAQASLCLAGNDGRWPSHPLRGRLDSRILLGRGGTHALLGWRDGVVVGRSYRFLDATSGTESYGGDGGRPYLLDTIKSDDHGHPPMNCTVLISTSPENPRVIIRRDGLSALARRQSLTSRVRGGDFEKGRRKK